MYDMEEVSLKILSCFKFMVWILCRKNKIGLFFLKPRFIASNIPLLLALILFQMVSSLQAQQLKMCISHLQCVLLVPPIYRFSIHYLNNIW
jgi:hypothetical protein